MGILQHHYHHQHRVLSAIFTVFAIILCLLVSSTSASSSSFSHASLPARSLFSSPTRHQLGRGMAMGLTSQEKIKSSRRGESVKRVMMMMNRRRVLIRMGVGSSPPTCRSRCGRCSPCKAVHVAIQPGRSVILEYYPEAWRCKCGNKLFMP
ncbi:hypothetical protein MKX01_025546 [Papaver californicum]|nr:hypothetical protein MKX01_025546 [Papaver californicum]